MKIRAMQWALPAMMVLLLGACSDNGGAPEDAAEVAPDVTAEMEAFYKSKPEFFKYKTPADLPADLVWQNGADLPEVGSPEAKKGGTFNYYVDDFPRTLRKVGPDSNGPFRGWILDFTLYGLLMQHPNVDAYTPGIASEWALEEETNTVYFKIDPEARWSDGQPITTRDFFFTFFFYQSPNIQAPWYNNWYGTQYSSITRFDDRTLAISIPNPKPHFEDNIVTLSPVPQHFFKEFGADFIERYQWRFVPTPGAYSILDKDIKKGRSITLTRQKDWWAKDKKYFKNRYNVDKVRLSVIRDLPKVFEAFKRGDLDLQRLNTSEDWYEKLPNTDEDVQNGYISKDIFYNDIPRPTYGLWINSSKPLLNNKDIRVGIHYASNWQLVIDKFFRGDYQRMRTSADGYGKVTHPTLKARTFDIEKAQESFAKAGFVERGSDGILVNDKGERLAFTVTTAYARYTDLLTILKEEASKAGLELRVEVLDMTAAFKKVNEKKQDISLSAINIGGRYPRYWEFFHSDNAYDQAFLEDGSVNPDRKVKVQTNNSQMVAEKDIDVMIDAYRQAKVEEEKIEYAFKLEERIREHATFVPGFVQAYERSAHWNWLKFPDDFDVKISHYVYEYQLFWVDEEQKKRTREAMKSGETFPVSINVHDQYKVE